MTTAGAALKAPGVTEAEREELLDVIETRARPAQGQAGDPCQLLQEVWGPEYGEETHYLRVHIAHIRAKLEPDPSRPRSLVTEPGVGYRLREP
jgi:DNA-binding response OmpR family regulator